MLKAFCVLKALARYCTRPGHLYFQRQQLMVRATVRMQSITRAISGIDDGVEFEEVDTRR